jgi:phage shock protein E
MSRFNWATKALVALVFVGLAAGLAVAQVAAGRITAAELKKLYDAGTVIVVDVRTPAAYRDSHLKGALSVPLDQVAAKAAELAKSGKPVVTYCT